MEKNSLKRTSDILFWIAVVFNIIFSIFLIVYGAIIKIKDNDSDGIFFLLYGIVDAIGIAIVIPVRVINEKERPLLAAIFTMIFSRNIGEISGFLLLFYAFSKRNVVEEKVVDRISEIENGNYSHETKNGDFKNKMSGVLFKHTANKARLDKGDITLEEYDKLEEELKQIVIAYKDELTKAYDALQDKLAHQIITISDFNNKKEEIEFELESANDYLENN